MATGGNPSPVPSIGSRLSPASLYAAPSGVREQLAARQMSHGDASPSGREESAMLLTANTGVIGVEEDDYDGLTFAGHMVAGAVAGMAEHMAMFPIDTIKTRMQALGHPGQRLHGSTVRQALMAVLKREGVLGLYGGVWAVAAGAGPAHALYFAVYEKAKEGLGANAEGHHPASVAAAGAVATIASDGVMTPCDVVKQRLQVARSPYTGVWDCIYRTWRREGVGAFFRSFRTTVVMNVPYTAINVPVYESTKKLLGAAGEGEGLLAQLTAGSLAGGSAALLTNPLDVVKTRLQLEGVNSATRYATTAVIPVMRAIIREEGRSALWWGVRARVLFHAPAAAICWGSYESMKKLLAPT